MKYAFGQLALLFLASPLLRGQDAISLSRQIHQVPDQDGIYYAGPEVTVPRMIRTVTALYPSRDSGKEIQGMTVMAMVIDTKGLPEHIQVLHHHGEFFDEAAVAAVKSSRFEPGTLSGKPVPVWIDVRVVFHADRSQAVPQVLVTERDLAPPDAVRLEDKHHKPLTYTPPFPVHTVDADFADPFATHPYVQVAIVEVLVGEDGLPKDVQVRRGLGFGLDEKATAAVWHYRFFPATNKGRPIAARRNLSVSFAEF
jgi:TonB family protein